jgi:hypothetical protein
MTKLFASLFALVILAAALPAMATCPGHEQMTVQTSPVVTTDAQGTAPITPVPPTTKTGG